MHIANFGSAHRSLSLLVVRNLQKGGSCTTSTGSFQHEEAAVLLQAPCGCLNTLISKAERSYPTEETPQSTSPTMPCLPATLKRFVNQESPTISRVSNISERIKAHISIEIPNNKMDSPDGHQDTTQGLQEGRVYRVGNSCSLHISESRGSPNMF